MNFEEIYVHAPKRGIMKFLNRIFYVASHAILTYISSSARKQKRLLFRFPRSTSLIKPDYKTFKNLPAFNLEEREVLLKLIQLPEKIQQSALELDPSILARHIYEIGKSFNQFYNAVPIVKEGADPALVGARLKITENVKKAITLGLGLLGIATPEKM